VKKMVVVQGMRLAIERTSETGRPVAWLIFYTPDP
jgi:hypothetical protein